MYLAYFDESGDSGLHNSPTQYFVLSCVLVHQANWLESLDHLIELRRRLRDKCAIPTRPELKSTDFRKGSGALRPLRLSRYDRMQIFERIFRAVDVRFPNLTIFAVAIDKEPAAAQGREPRETAWQFALERVDRFTRPTNEPAMLFPDEGHGPFIRKLLRRMRRHHTIPRRWGGGTFSVPTGRIIEDPNDRKSHDSYFVQLADWAAYAAHRSGYIDPLPDTTGLWDLLGGRRLLDVNKNVGGPPGIKLYP